ncbi:DUF3800 domain-containing protein [Luteococcus sp. H138]|uniref:DUF3800 domain-containing protein n=1 Tax=unclassified Luteococcus TaxID=2639923 RepID=UPI00313E5682
MRLVYVDDSGAERSGIASFSWVEVPEEHWARVLGCWLDYRDLLWRHHGVGKAVEIHSTSFTNGRGRPSTNDEFNASKARRRTVFAQGIDVLASDPAVQVGTVFGRTAGRASAFREERMRVYQAMVRLLDERLRSTGERALVVMDGDGTDTGYLSAHRALRRSTRHVLEDPLFQHSDRSHWLQMADMVAYSAYQEVLALPSKTYAHGWYPRLRPSDVLGGPWQV